MGNISLLDVKEFVINLSSFLVAGATIGAFAIKWGKGILNKQLEPFNERIDNLEKARVLQHEETKEEIKSLKEELDKNSLNTMKNTICNDNIPISERLIVGKEYLGKGGNGAVKIYLHKLEEDFEKQLQENDK